jgi:hypothetical protein
MSVYKTKDWLENKPYFVKKIKDKSVDLKSFISEYLEWMKKPTYHRFDAYAIVYREALGVDKNGKNADPSTWGTTFDRIKQLHGLIMKDGSIFAKVISCEGLAHRYVDLFLASNDEEYFNLYESLYEKTHKLALKGKYWKNVDSSLYWWGIAYTRCGKDKKAIDAFCRIKNRKGERYKKSPAYQKKMKYARNCCKKKRVL